MKLSWGHATEKSFGNGILRISIKDVLVAGSALLAAGGFLANSKAKEKASSEQTAAILRSQDNITATVVAVRSEVGEIKDRVLVLETIDKTTRAINRGVKGIQSEDIFDPNVTQVKVKR